MTTLPRGGHFPGHIRDVFLEAIDAFTNWEAGAPEPSVTLQVHYEPRPITISAACGMLWNCADVLPGYAYRSLVDCDLEIGRQTYAAAARAMHANIAAA